MILKYIIKNKRLLYRISLTLFIVAFIKYVNFIPISGIDQSSLFPELKNSQILNFLRSFSQGNSFVLDVFTLGILPNIHASIIIQMLALVFPPLQRLQKEEGKLGRRKILRIIRFLTSILAFLYGLIIAFYIKPFIFGWTFFKAVDLAATLTVGALIILWFSEIITEQGFGNGTSLLICVNISSSFPTVWRKFNNLESNLIKLFFIGLCIIGIIIIITVQISVINVKIVNNFNVIEPTSPTYIPFRLTPSGLMPLILTSAVLNALAVILSQYSVNLKNSVFYLSMYFLVTLFFGYFYTKKSIKPVEISEYMQKQGFRLEQVNSGYATIQFLQETLDRISIFGGILLAGVVTLPSLLVYLNPSLNQLLGMGTTGLFILVGVSVDLIRRLETYKIVDLYDNW